MKNYLGYMLSSIKNGQKSGLKNIFLSGSLPDFCIKILNILYKEGYIRGFRKIIVKNKEVWCIFLKYNRSGIGVINSIVQISKPGNRVYTSIQPLWKVKSGFGIFIISTSKGIFTDFDARLLNLGGEILCSIA